jgi:hypothetical protein
MSKEKKPQRIPVDFESIPKELKQQANWLMWKWTYDKKKDKWDKPPLQRSGKFASSTNSKTWCTFDEVKETYSSGKFDGIGFVLEPPWVGVDLDDCRDPAGQIRDWSRSILDRVKSYAEVSPSGKGLKIFCRGTIPHDHHNERMGLFHKDRYFCVTGSVFEKFSEIRDAQPALDFLIKEFQPKESTKQETKTTESTKPPQDDQTIIDRMLNAKNKDKVLKLWNGSTEGCKSHSEADYRLCLHIGFYTKDPDQIDRIFRHSKLYRQDRWDRKSYRDKTITKALAKVLESEKEKTEQKKPKIFYTAVFPALVDIVEDDSGAPSFLIMQKGNLQVIPRIEEEGRVIVPPPAETLRWLLPRAAEVLKHYTEDTDRQLCEDLIQYHKGISELPSEAHYLLLALWDFHSYMAHKSQYSPMLWLYAIPERGKSRTGKGCIYVAFRGLHLESLRDAFIVRTAENQQTSLFFDVMDFWKKAEQHQTEDIVLLRYEAGATVPRVIHPERGPHRDTVFYSIYGPTIIATNENVSQILATRAIQIVMPEGSRDFEDDVLPERGLPFRERLVAFRARHFEESLPEASKPLRGRLGDILRPLRQIVLMVCPDLEEDFLKLCRKIETEKMNSLSETLEAKLLTAISELEDRVVHGLLEMALIAEKINEGVPDQFKRSQASVTQAVKRMGFKSSRPKGKTHMVTDQKLFEKLSVRYLGKSAQSAPSANGEKDQDDSGCTLGAEGAHGPEDHVGQSDSAQSAPKVHPPRSCNKDQSAEGAEGADFQSVCIGENDKDGVSFEGGIHGSE